MKTKHRIASAGASLLMLLTAAGCGQPAGAMTEETESTALWAASQHQEVLQLQAVQAYQTIEKNAPEVRPVATQQRYNFRTSIQSRKRQNSDVVGWLYVPGTHINNVIVQNPSSATNDYYLTRDFNGSPSKNGTFCADRRCDFTTGTRDTLSRLTTLYGHSWDDNPDGELFAQLKRYKDPEFAREHPYIYFSTEEENMVWEVFAVFDTTVHFPYVWPDLPDNIFSSVMNVVQRSSLYDYGAILKYTDKILTLSTCTFTVNDTLTLPLDVENDYRFVIMARLVDENATLKDRAALTVNSNPMTVDQIPDIDLPWL